MNDATHRLRSAIDLLEAHRATLGDDVVALAAAPLRERLARDAEAAASQTLRQLSVLFIDVVGSTALGERLQPEAIHHVMDGALAGFQQAVRAHGGQVLQYAGDSVLAVFGAPVAAEDDAERAVRAALAILADAVPQAEQVRRQHGFDGFGVRAGIATGDVLLGRGLEDVQSVRGMTVNLAARMEQTAPAGGLRICPDTWRLVRGRFQMDRQPALLVKGRDEPVVTWLVHGVAQGGRAQAARGVGGLATPMVGRAAELSWLHQAASAWVAAGPAAPRVVKVLGEAGLGKSRLVAEFRAGSLAAWPAARWLEAFGDERGQGRPYGLLRQLFAGLVRLLDSDTPAGARGKWLAEMAPLLGSQGDAAVLGHLLGLDFSAHPEVQPLLGDASGGRQLRDRGFFHAAQALRRMAADGPLMVMLDDLHWADAGTLEFLALLGSRFADLPLFVLCTSRPPQDGVVLEHGLLHLTLAPLAGEDSQVLADALLARLAAPPAALRERLTAGAEGNPFFMEELVNMLIDLGAIDVDADGAQWRLRPDRLDETRLPRTLAGVLQARLDALPADEARVLHLAAVVGRAFWDDALHALGLAGPLPLQVLVARQLVVERPVSSLEGRREFSFRHPLMHQACYGRVLARDRTPAHATLARWLESLPGEPPMALIAEHHERGGEPAHARLAWQRAARLSQARYANAQALEQADRALALTAADAARERFALSLLRAQVLGLLADPEPLQRELQALEDLAQQVDDAALQSQAADRRARALLDSGDALGALGQAERAWQLAQADEPLLAAQAGGTLVQALSVLGRHAESRHRAQQVLALARRSGDKRTEGATLNALGITADDHGDFGEAIAHYRLALACHRRTGNRSHEAGVLSNLGYAALGVGDHAAAEEGFLAARELFARIGQREKEAVVLVNLGLVALNRGHPAEALGHVRQALPMLQAARSRSAEAAALRVGGQARLAMGEALAAVADLTAASEAFAALELPSLHMEAEASLCEALLAAGDEEAAHRRCLAVLAALQAGVPIEGTEEPMKIHLACWRVLSACGDGAAAGLLAVARGLLLQRAARIGDEALRRACLEQVPHHRALMAAGP